MCIRDSIKYECDKAVEAGIDIVVLYNSARVTRSKCPLKVRFEGNHVPMKCWKDGVLKWDYDAVKKALQ